MSQKTGEDTPNKKQQKQQEKENSKAAKQEQANEEEAEEQQENPPASDAKSRSRRGRPASKPKGRSEEDEEDEEEKKPVSKPSKKFKIDGRDVYKRELLRKTDWPTDDQINAQIKDLLTEVEGATYTLSKDDLYKIYQTMDLTSLNSTDGDKYIKDWLKNQLFAPLQKDSKLKPGAICVYPNFANLVSSELNKTGIKTAVVSTCFPTGQTFLDVKIQETKIAIKEGAEEIDMVVNRGLWNEGEELECLREVSEIKKACNNVHLKVILENCELLSLSSIYKLSFLSLCAGGDFIKTSTGKGKHGAKLNEFAAMCLAMRDYLKDREDFQKGIKAAGGIQDTQTAWRFIVVAERILGTTITPEFFRLGASSLAKDVIAKLQALQ